MGKADLDPRVVAKSRFVCVSVAYAFQESYSVPRPAVEPRWAAHVSALPVAASGGVVSAAHDFAHKGRATLCRSCTPIPRARSRSRPKRLPRRPQAVGTTWFEKRVSATQQADGPARRFAFVCWLRQDGGALEKLNSAPAALRFGGSYFRACFKSCEMRDVEGDCFREQRQAEKNNRHC